MHRKKHDRHHDGCCHEPQIAAKSCCGRGHRKVLTVEEEAKCLEGYLGELQAETKAVEERLGKLRTA